MERENKTERVFDKINIERIKELENFLYVQYPKRLLHINRCIYLGISPDEKRYDLEIETYQKEQELRKLTGKEPLGDIKSSKIL